MRYWSFLGWTAVSFGLAYAYGPNIYRHVTQDRQEQPTSVASIPDKPTITMVPKSEKDTLLISKPESFNNSPSLEVIQSGLSALEKSPESLVASPGLQKHFAEKSSSVKNEQMGSAAVPKIAHGLKKKNMEGRSFATKNMKKVKKFSSQTPHHPRFISQVRSPRLLKDKKAVTKEDIKKENPNRDLSCHKIGKKTRPSMEQSHSKQRKNIQLTNFSKN